MSRPPTAATPPRPPASDAGWALIVCGAAMLMITMGMRQTTGLFVSPINTATGLGVVTISLTMAVAQFVWGLSQPVFGALADRHGPLRVLIVGGVLLSLGNALTPFAHEGWQLMLTMGIMTAAGAAAGSFSLLIGATARRLDESRRSFAAGFINAGGSFGQFIFAPIIQGLITFTGWTGAMFAMAAISLLTIPLAFLLVRPARGSPSSTPSAAGSTPPAAVDAAGTDRPTPAGDGHGAVDTGPALGRQIREAFRDRSYLMLHAGFFTCGFHIAFLVTHLPGEVQLCGLPASVASLSLALIGLFNIAGSLVIGILGQRYRMKWLLAWMYGSRALAIALYLLAPKTPETFYVFAAVLGFTWLATVPPTAGLVGKLFGTRHLGTLFGLTLVSHQAGAFLGAWLGGIAITASGDYLWMWYADIVLALIAALLNLPIREAPVRRRSAAGGQGGLPA